MPAVNPAQGLLTRQQKNKILRGVAQLRRVVPGGRMTPDFIIIGAQKSGTTSLCFYLSRHGSYLEPLLKNIAFFDKNFTRGLAWYLRYYPSARQRDRRAAQTGAAVLTGEAGTHYLLDPWAAERMHCTLPDIKLIVMLRDPVDRAISHYYHNLTVAGRETASDPLTAFQLERDRIGAHQERMRRDPHYCHMDFHHFSYLERGHYAEQLSPWFELFPRENIGIFRSEALFADTDGTFRAVCRFLGIPEKTLPAYPVANKGKGKRDAGKAIEFATEYFRTRNEDLWKLLGQRWDWRT
jgi:hypothetical protein